MTSQTPVISIIIASFDNDKFLQTCIKSIKQNTKIAHEIIFEDGTFSGPCSARNIGAKKARGKYLLFLDYDTKAVNKNFLATTIKYLDQHKDIGGGQLKLLRLGTNKFDSAGDKLTPFGFLAERAQEAIDQSQFDKVSDIFSGKGAAMIVRKKLFLELGRFDESYFMYWEEPDLTWRIWKAGLRYVFLPFDTVHHAYGTKHKQISKKWETQITFYGCRNHLATMIKNGNGLNGVVMFLTVSFAWVGLFVMFLFKLNFAKAGMVILAYVSLITKLPKLLLKRSYSDNSWMKQIQDKRPLKWYFGKGISYVLGKPY